MIVTIDPRPDARPDWEDLTPEEQEEEWNMGTDSSFHRHPHFEPVWCHDCNTDVFLTENSTCPVDSDHDVWSVDPANSYTLEY